MEANYNLLKCVMSEETLLGPNSTLVLHHALVWITKIIQNEQNENTGFVLAKFVYTSVDFTKHSDMTAEKWDQLKEVVIPLQPLMSKKDGILIRSAVDLIASPIQHIPPHTFICASKTCHMEMCIQARGGAVSHSNGSSGQTAVSHSNGSSGQTAVSHSNGSSGQTAVSHSNGSSGQTAVSHSNAPTAALAEKDSASATKRVGPKLPSVETSPCVEGGEGISALVGSEPDEVDIPNLEGLPTASPSVAAIEAAEGEATNIAHTSAAPCSLLGIAAIEAAEGEATNIAHTSAAQYSYLGITAIEAAEGEATNIAHTSAAQYSHLGEGELDEMDGHSEAGASKPTTSDDVDRFFNNAPDLFQTVQDNPAVMAPESRSTGKRKTFDNGIPPDLEGSISDNPHDTTNMKEPAADFCAAYSGQSVVTDPGILLCDSGQTSASTLQEEMLVSMSSTEMLEMMQREQKNFFVKHFADLQAANSILVAANAALMAERSNLVRTQAATQKMLQEAEHRLQSAKDDTDDIQKKYSSLQQNMQKGYEQTKITMRLLRPACSGQSAGSAVPSSPSASVLDTEFAVSAPSTMDSAASLVSTSASKSALGSKLT